MKNESINHHHTGTRRCSSSFPCNVHSSTGTVETDEDKNSYINDTYNIDSPTVL